MQVDGAAGNPVGPPPSPARPARLRPFRALRLAPEMIGEDGAARTLSRPYREVADRLRLLAGQGRVTEDATPALYLHEYSAHGMTIRGVVGLLDLTTRADSADDSIVLPHEAIHVDRADDLARRMVETGLDPAPILLVHRGDEGGRAALERVAAGEPTWQLTDRAGQHHRIWRIEDPRDLAALEATIAGSTLLLADGHHRYAAYLRLQQEHPGTGWDHGLAMVVDQGTTPFFLGAIHRVLRGTSLEAIARAAGSAGTRVSWLEESTALAALGAGTWLATDGTGWVSITHPEDDGRATVERLHAEVLPLLDPQPSLSHHHTVRGALSETGRGAIAVLLPALDFETLDRTLHAQRLLPEKATSFQPKPHLGVLMRRVPAAPGDR